MSGPDDEQQPSTPFIPSGPISPLGVQIPGMVSPEAIQKTQAAQRKVAEATTLAKSQDSQLAAQGAGTDPNYSRTEDRFQSMTHEQMYEAVHGGADGTGGMDAAGMHQARQTWFEASADLENLSSFHLLGMNNIFNHGLWQGATASAAQVASERFAHAVNEAAQVFGAVSQRMDALAWAADAVKLAVPPPSSGATAVSPDPDNPAQSLLPGLINPDYAHQLETQRTSARNQAVQALQALYTPNFPPAGVGIPAYTKPPEINSGPSIGPGTATGPGLDGGHGTGAGTHGSASTAQPAANPSQSGPQDGTTPNQGSGTTPAGFQLPSNALGAPTTTAGTSTVPAGLETTTRPVGGFGGTGMDGLPGVGIGGLPGGEPGSPSAGPGRSIPGAPNTTGTGVGPRTAGMTGQTSPGMRMGSMSPHGQGKHSKSEEDEHEHYSPDYLHGVQPELADGLPSPVEVIGRDLIRPDENPYQGPDYPATTQAAGYTPAPAPAVSHSWPTAPSPSGEPGSSHSRIAAEPFPSTPEPSNRTPASSPAAERPSATPDADAQPTDTSATDTNAPADSSDGFSGSGLDLGGLFAEYGWEEADPTPAEPESEKDSGSDR